MIIYKRFIIIWVRLSLYVYKIGYETLYIKDLITHSKNSNATIIDTNIWEIVRLHAAEIHET
jgi:hypothetical protein